MSMQHGHSNHGAVSCLTSDTYCVYLSEFSTCPGVVSIFVWPCTIDVYYAQSIFSIFYSQKKKSDMMRGLLCEKFSWFLLMTYENAYSCRCIFLDFFRDCIPGVNNHVYQNCLNKTGMWKNVVFSFLVSIPFVQEEHTIPITLNIFNVCEVLAPI